MCKRTIHSLKGILLQVLPTENKNVEIHKKNLLQLYKAFQCHIVGFYNILVSGKSVLTKAPLKKSRSEIVEGCAFHFTCDRRPLNTRHPLKCTGFFNQCNCLHLLRQSNKSAGFYEFENNETAHVFRWMIKKTLGNQFFS